MLPAEGADCDNILLGAGGKFTATRSICLLSGEFDNPVGEAPSGVLFRLGKKMVNHA